MLNRGNPYVYLAVAIALVLVAAAVGSAPLRVLAGALGVAAAIAAAVLFVRQQRDPNGPPGQH